MKKALLASSAIVAVAALASPANAADRIKLSLGGYMEQYIGFISSEKDLGSATAANNTDLPSFDQQSDTEIWFSGSTTLDNGIKLAVRVELEGEATGRLNGTATTIDESWLDIQTAWGTVRLGADDNVTDLQSVEPRKGQDNAVTDYDNWLPPKFGQLAGGVNGSNNGITVADDPYSVRSASDDNQILYITPVIAGFQVGFSYAPDINTTGKVGIGNRAAGSASNTAATLNWTGNVLGVGIAAGYAYEHETGTGTATQVGSFINHNVGLNLTYAGFGIGGTYARQMEKHGVGPTVPSNDGHSWKMGVWYINGPMEVGYNHMYQMDQGDTTNKGVDENTVDGAFFDWTISDGVIWENMIFHVNYDEEHNVDATEQSGGWGVVTGLVVKF